MRIGEDDNFISLEKPDEWPFSPYHAVARVKYGAAEFSCCHDEVVLDTSTRIHQALSDFQNLTVHSIEIPASESGWLRLSRDAHGQIAVTYRLAKRRLAAVMEGEVTISGEFADRFCNELRVLLTAKRT